MSAVDRNAWCIVRTSAAKTLPLARSLNLAGIEAWSPIRMIQRPRPGQYRRLAMGLRREMIEVGVPILPTFVFVRAARLRDLAEAAAAEISAHPPFSIFHHGERVPLIADAAIEGLRGAEVRAEEEIQAIRDADSRAAEREARAERQRSDKARRNALRAQHKEFAPGTEVKVLEEPALSGVVGRIVRGSGTRMLIDFGGILSMEVEAWQVLPA